ncbi:MAG: hypothetical protein AB7H80_09865 [Candidatus Kapaibacterium sp.]
MQSHQFFSLFLLGTLFLLSCGADPAPLADPGPPPPAPEVSASDTLLNLMGKEIERGIEEGDLERLVSLTDYVQFSERIYFPDSLSKSERENAEKVSRKSASDEDGVGTFWKGLIRSVELGVRVDYLSTRRSDGTRLLFRLVFPSGGLSYLELLLGEGQGGVPVVIDIYEYLDGEFTSRTVHRLIAADNRDPLFQLLNVNNRAAEAKEKLYEASELIIQEEFAKADYILNEVQEPYRSMRQTEALRLIVRRGVNGENIYRKALSRFLKKYGKEPGVEIALIEQSLNFGQFSEVIQLTDGLDSLVKDPYLNLMRAQAYYQNNQDSLSRHFIESVVAYDSTFVLPYRISFLIALNEKEHAFALEQLRQLTALNDRWLSLDDILQAPMAAPFKASPEYSQAKGYIEKIVKKK